MTCGCHTHGISGGGGPSVERHMQGDAQTLKSLTAVDGPNHVDNSGQTGRKTVPSCHHHNDTAGWYRVRILISATASIPHPSWLMHIFVLGHQDHQVTISPSLPVPRLSYGVGWGQGEGLFFIVDITSPSPCFFCTYRWIFRPGV